MSGESSTVDRGDERPVYHRAHQRPGRRHALLVRLSDEEKAVIDAAAARAELTATGYAAKAAVCAATNEVTPGSGTDDLKELQREVFAARRAVNMFGTNVNQAAAAFNTTAVVPDWVGEAVRLCTAAVARLDEVAARIDRRLR